MPIKRIPDIPSTCLHVNIRPQFKKQQNGVMNIQLPNMREIFLTFTIHSFWSHYIHFCLVTQCTCI